MSVREKMRLTKSLVEVIVGKEKFKVSVRKAKAMLVLLAAEDEGSVPASEAFPDLADEKKRPAVVLRGLRERDGLTQEILAKKIDAHQSHIAAMESGDRTIGPDISKRLAKVFKINPNVFSSKSDK